ncbi:MAG: MGH1-like glycoside hydrolase domain-containing protein [Sedimentisphaerales bacterium]
MKKKNTKIKKQSGADYSKFFSMNGKSILHEEKDLGIFNGMLTINTPYTQALALGGMWAPPYLSSDFLFEVRLFGDSVKAENYIWSPREIQRTGEINGIDVQSRLTLADNCRGAILAFELTNQSKDTVKIPVQINIAGTFAYNEVWDFFKQHSKPAAWNDWTKECLFSEKDGTIIWGNGAGVVAVNADIAGLNEDGYCPCWKTNVSLKPKQSRTFYITFGMGEKKNAKKICEQLAANPKRAIELSREKLTEQTADIFEKIPVFKSQNKELEQFYQRSLTPFVLNKWCVPEFVLNPYYSTGSINGGCVCSYLYDFSEGWEITNLYDPDALREHVKVFLNMGLGKHFAFLPITGEPYGPWYPVNQEKIIFLIYYYVMITGNKSFLFEKNSGKTVLEQVMSQATHGDDLKKPVALIDYGKGNNHLELRRKYRYDNYVPDLNARRYANYKAVAQLCDMVGHDGEYLRKRAEELKSLINKKMWSKKHKWFYHLDEKWNKDIRYTVQMFKLIGSGVLDKEQEDGILSHLNEKEFLSEYGLHSMSKRDAAYDQADIDNGGGGICTCFPPQIMERLYKAGRPEEAENILKRILWWGQRMPYWGDSFVANNIDYRRDTPLQNAIGGVSAAQCIIFGMFGVKTDADGNVTINPVPPSFSPSIELRGLKLRGKEIDICVNKNNYVVTCGGKAIKSKVGRSTTV